MTDCLLGPLVPWDNRDTVPVVTHFFALFPLVVLLPYSSVMYESVVWIFLSFVSSVVFHFCRWSGGEMCVQDLETHRLQDHATAQFGIVLVGLHLFPFEKLHMQKGWIVTVAAIHFYYYAIGGPQFVAVGIYIFFVFLTLVYLFFGKTSDGVSFVNTEFYNRWQIVTAVSLGVLGIVFFAVGYFDVYCYYWIHHSLWHALIYLALGFIYLGRVVQNSWTDDDMLKEQKPTTKDPITIAHRVNVWARQRAKKL